MAKTSSIPAAVHLRIRLSEDLHDTYAERAIKHKREVEDEISLRLKSCRDHTSLTPIYVTDQTRNELTLIAGRTIASEADLLKWAKDISTMKIGGVEIQLSNRLLSRLETRAYGRSLADAIRDAVVERLEEYVGLR